MIVSGEKEIDALVDGGKKLAQILVEVAKIVRPGIATIELDRLAEKLIREAGGEPSFKNYKTRGAKSAYPASLCVSVNDEIVHAIPGAKVLIKGDIVGLDIGMQYKGFFTDMAITVGVGSINKENKKLIDTTRRALEIGIAKVRPGGRIGDIGAAIQGYAEGEGFGVVRELVGHGVGRAVHEDPEVPNWGRHGTGPEIVEGMVLALEPMITIGSPRVKVSPDGWTWSTESGKNSAHFEHTILITRRGAKILTV
jgi:methionyl aminopeptidase